MGCPQRLLQVSIPQFSLKIVFGLTQPVFKTWPPKPGALPLGHGSGVSFSTKLLTSSEGQKYLDSDNYSLILSTKRRTLYKNGCHFLKGYSGQNTSSFVMNLSPIRVSIKALF